MKKNIATKFPQSLWEPRWHLQNTRQRDEKLRMEEGWTQYFAHEDARAREEQGKPKNTPGKQNSKCLKSQQKYQTQKDT